MQSRLPAGMNTLINGNRIVIDNDLKGENIMTTKQSIDWLVNELNTEGSRATLNGKNNHIGYEYIPDGRYYKLFKDGRRIGGSLSARELEAVLDVLCSIL